MWAFMQASMRPTLALGTVDASISLWLVLAVLILLGDKIIWWATERAWGTFTLPSSPHT
jgi:hypothetical protein